MGIFETLLDISIVMVSFALISYLLQLPYTIKNSSHLFLSTFQLVDTHLCMG